MKKYIFPILCGTAAGLSTTAAFAAIAVGFVTGLRPACLGISQSEEIYINVAKNIFLISLLCFFIFLMLAITRDTPKNEKLLVSFGKGVLATTISFFVVVVLSYQAFKFVAHVYIETDSIYELNGDCQM